MMGRIFWLITMVAVGLVVYLATVLYVPGLMFRHQLASTAAGIQPNSFFIMKPQTQGSLVATASAKDIVGLCLVDLSKGKVVISAAVPAGLWTFSIFDATGKQVYGINDAEAAQGNFTVELTKSKSIIQQVMGKPDAEDATNIENVGWHAEIAENQGLVVLWVPVSDELRRPQLEQVVKTTRCEQK